MDACVWGRRRVLRNPTGRFWICRECVRAVCSVSSGSQYPQALSTSRFLFPCTVTICSTSQSICRTRVRGPERGFVQSMWCHLVWVLSDVPGRALAAGSLQQCCAASLQLPAVGVWSTACWLGHTELLAVCREGDCGHTACPHQT